MNNMITNHKPIGIDWTARDSTKARSMRFVESLFFSNFGGGGTVILNNIIVENHESLVGPY
ncbi:hypothetical protein SAMN05421578_10982 [Paenibacillus macquariensis]|uniref:Uncharacterized protein n=1 Tax=Paenibacillus macquariensis TaxID=948756 RepID=A0ABY1K498_9BACL|nr:hypothetical protein SAMN05421578_10982 [Paenibacillus macquariensis]